MTTTSGRKSATLEGDVAPALEWLKRHATRATLEGMARYAIPSDKALGVAMRDIKALGKTLGRNHDLVAARRTMAGTSSRRR